MSIFKDKYFIISVSVILIFILFWTSEKDEIHDDDIKGIVFDVKETKNGFTFFIETSDGKHEKCFFKECPEDLKSYSVRGTLSEDGTIIFVEKMIILEYPFNG